MTSGNDYRTRIKPYYNGQGHIMVYQKVKIQMWSCSTEQTRVHKTRIR